MLSYFAALLATNIKAGFARRGEALVSVILMFANNLVFFIIWMIYFARFRELAGWQQQDVALLYGMAAWAFGLSVALTGGFRDMGRAIADGGLDVHLGRPRHPLPSLLLSRSIPSGFGDLASAPVMWLVLGGRSLTDLPLLVALASAGAVVMLATFVMGQCLVFWWPRAVRLGEELVNVVLMISVYPQHVFGAGMRIVLFTLLPVAFISQLPVEAVREADLAKALAVLAAALVYGALAIFVFDRGLKRYASGNRLLVNR
jgi:ABC-2 type transport system permease protein